MPMKGYIYIEPSICAMNSIRKEGRDAENANHVIPAPSFQALSYSVVVTPENHFSLDMFRKSSSNVVKRKKNIKASCLVSLSRSAFGWAATFHLDQACY
jgi:hypothetical protein